MTGHARDFVRKYIEENTGCGLPPPSDGENLFSSGLLDSISFIAFVQFLEKEFEIRFDRTEYLFENFETIDKIAALLERKKSEVASR